MSALTAADLAGLAERLETVASGYVGNEWDGTVDEPICDTLTPREARAIASALRRLCALERAATLTARALDDMAWLGAELVEWRGCDHDVGMCSCNDRWRVERAVAALASLAACGVVGTGG